MRCSITGCPEAATNVLRGISIRLPNHPSLVDIGDLNVCPKHERETRTGVRTSIRDDIVASAIARA